MRSSISCRRCPTRLVMPVRFRVRHQDSPPALGGWTLEPWAEVRAQLQRHVEARQARGTVQLEARDVMQRELARGDQVQDLVEPHDGAVGSVERAARNEGLNMCRGGFGSIMSDRKSWVFAGSAAVSGASSVRADRGGSRTRRGCRPHSPLRLRRLARAAHQTRRPRAL